MSNVLAVENQAAYTLLINSIIAMVHGLLMSEDDKVSKKLYEARTRKILSYSNLIATSSNLMVISVTGNMRSLDLGGLAVAVFRLITDAKFIRQVKEEFVFGSYRDMILGI